jgi:mannose-6-phosphate isomerase-like protein (cupin superfamily)
MNPYNGNIEQETLQNTNFRKVLYTGTHAQLVVMSLNPSEEIGMEVHDHVDQFFRIEQGTAKFEIDNQVFEVGPDHAIIVPAGSQHNVTNVSDQTLKLYTIYSPPNHPQGTIHATKAEADLAESEEHGK